MTLVFIYGAPAVGKLSVATEISEKIGYKLFHNHLTVDLVRSIFPYGSKEASELSEQFRLEIFESAAKAGIPGVIFTYVYAKNLDDDSVYKMKDRVEKAGGKVVFVLLICAKPELLKRVESESRKKFTKLQDAKELEEVLEKYDLESPVPNTNSLIIDNTNLNPEDVANQIINHFNLTRM